MISPPPPFPWPEDRIARYTARRVTTPPRLDGRLDTPDWRNAEKSPRFVDLVTGKRTIHDTRAAVLWDDDNLYVGFWIEEPFVAATLTERDSLVWSENDIEVFVAGDNGYYELEINALGTIYEALFLWEDRYGKAGFAADPALSHDAEGAKPWNGVGFTTHPRGPRLGLFRWDLQGLRTAVHVDGTINDDTDRDRGWTVEIAMPLKSLAFLGLTVPPRDGDTWRMDFSRFNAYKEAKPAEDSGGWAWSAHGVWDSHIPELFPYIRFSTEPVGGEK